MAESEPERPYDTETAIRLLHPDWFKDGRIVSAAFRAREPLSFYIQERLPLGQYELLHIERYERWGSASLNVARLRSTSYSSGDDVLNSFDLRLSPAEADPPHDIYASAHSTLEGPNTKAAPSALANQFNEHGTVLREPAAL